MKTKAEQIDELVKEKDELQHKMEQDNEMVYLVKDHADSVVRRQKLWQTTQNIIGILEELNEGKGASKMMLTALINAMLKFLSVTIKEK
jgi:adenosyl cobinamide kinase/adenosyl cobinamide phosphate guanylyltransferase